MKKSTRETIFSIFVILSILSFAGLAVTIVKEIVKSVK
jgi:hypothetical protein